MSVVDQVDSICSKMFILKKLGIIGKSGQIKGYGDKLRQISEFTMYACRARTTYSGTAAATIHALQVMYTLCRETHQLLYMHSAGLQQLVHVLFFRFTRNYSLVTDRLHPLDAHAVFIMS